MIRLAPATHVSGQALEQAALDHEPKMGLAMEQEAVNASGPL